MNKVFSSQNYLNVAETASAYPSDGQEERAVSESKITNGQLKAVALRFQADFENLLQRTGSGASASIVDNILSVKIEHSLSVAEHNLMRQTKGRDFFQHYIEELAEQMYPTLVEHIEDILPVSVTYSGVKVECAKDAIVFLFNIQTNRCWTQTLVESFNYKDYA